MTGGVIDWPTAAVEAFRTAVAGWPGTLAPLARDAVGELAHRLTTGPADRVGAVAVPSAVFIALRAAAPPAGLLASAAAAYLAWDLLDDDMDGDPPTLWAAAPRPHRVLGAHLLIATATGWVTHGTTSGGAELTELFLSMAASVVDGQLRGERPLAPSTSVADVAAGVDARSGTMLAGFAELATVAAGADTTVRRSARRFGRELALARQLVNDLAELLSGRTSDLRNRTATLVAAFALQRLAPDDRAHLVQRLHSAAADEDLRRGLIGGDLASALTDARRLAGLHLSAARAAADAVAEHCVDPRPLDMLIHGTGRRLESVFQGAQ